MRLGLHTVIGLFLLGCGGSDKAGPNRPNACADASVGWFDQGATCHDTVAHLQGACKDPYSGSADLGLLCTAESPGVLVYTGTCDGLRMVGLGFGYGNTLCSYDTDAGALVGVSSVGDYPGYCNHPAAQVSGGRLPSPCCGLTLLGTCPATDAAPE
jgi:hypothetical protein